jgi:hypothetical protein
MPAPTTVRRGRAIAETAARGGDRLALHATAMKPAPRRVDRMPKPPKNPVKTPFKRSRQRLSYVVSASQ